LFSAVIAVVIIILIVFVVYLCRQLDATIEKSPRASNREETVTAKKLQLKSCPRHLVATLRWHRQR